MSTQKGKKLTRKEKVALAAQLPAEIIKDKQVNKSTTFNKRLKLWVVFLLAFLAYGNTLSNLYVLDDFSVISENNIVNKGTGEIGKVWNTSYRTGYLGVNDGLYRPLSLFMFAIEWQISPNNPALGHFINILLFALGLYLLWVFCSRIYSETNEWLSLLTVLFFALHPIHTEVVANIKSRDELLCFVFSLACLNALLKSDNKPLLPHCLWSGFYFFMACLSKESAVLILPIFIACVYFFKENKLSFLVKGSSFILPALFIFLFIRFKVLGSVVGIQEVSYLDNPIGTQKELLPKIIGGVQVMGDYIRLFVWPYPLVFDYSFNSLGNLQFSIGWLMKGLAPLLASILFMLIWLRKKPLSAFAIVFMMIGFVLYCHLFFKIGAAKAERFTFLSSTGFCILAASLISPFLKNTPLNLKALNMNSKIIIPLGVVFVCMLLITWNRNTQWKDNYTLYSHDLNLNPASAKIHYYLGLEIVKNRAENATDSIQKINEIKTGLIHLKNAIKISPDFADAYSECGVAYYKMKMADSSAYYFKKALDFNPTNSVAISNLASYYFNRGDYRQALQMYQRSLEIYPRFANAMLNSGSCYGMMGDYQKAIDCFLKTLEIEPGNRQAITFLAMTYEKTGDKQKAAYYQNMLK